MPKPTRRFVYTNIGKTTLKCPWFAHNLLIVDSNITQ